MTRGLKSPEAERHLNGIKLSRWEFPDDWEDSL
jgi:hypothetical protein